ncbi:4Fe-4S dicluster domain-containing protein [Alteribacillus bidgolensis]|uniref:Fe-S-cluster-containing dehydrogenase component n=1 Tax=Alteribacillus bidgolensis TaxID=930129 RepID=A0A1G8CKE0_9BACI|nr:4Fe-4S dicluster domain-containing protein [Alteribacillus bidgolensis]SDH45895.1 Fe-S-cluster-containing dehydrogenase component [Alteribacillus bidgolensis]
MNKIMYLEFERCIGCRACQAACRECGGHDAKERNYVEYVDFMESRQTYPMLCMQCKDPACARVCPANAIQITEDGVVLSAMEEKCIGCRNCTFGCPFGIPKFDFEENKMYKCDMCYDRSQYDIAPMCASVCPSDAIRFIDFDEMQALRRRRTQMNLVEGKKPTEQDKWEYVPEFFGVYTGQ